MTIDADLVILDEVDAMDEWVLSLALKRLGSSSLGWVRAVSTPTIPEAGINSLFLQSDQRYYFLPCPSCGLKQRLTWEDNVDVDDPEVICSRCRTPMDIWAQGEWVPAHPNNSHWHGYHVSKLYSPMASIRAMVHASTSPGISEVQEFYRSDLGQVYIPPGGSLTIAHLDACRQNYTLPEGSKEPTSMGIDVGAKLHVVIREQLDEDQVGKALFIGIVSELSDFDALMARYNVKACLIDALPEMRLAREFQERHNTVVWRAYYDRRQGDHEKDWGDKAYHINRTLAIDETMQLFRRSQLPLPSNARDLGGRISGGIGEYYRQMTALQRTLDQDDEGNWSSRYVDNNKADHFAHAEVYCRLAQPRGNVLRITNNPFR